jgi:hypothetical protein
VSYCRFGWNGSDVYVYESAEGICCCGCWLSEESVYFDTPELTIEHLIEHRKAGHFVPEYAIAELWQEIEGAKDPVRPEPEEIKKAHDWMKQANESACVRNFIEATGTDKQHEPLLREFYRKLKGSS